MDKNDKIVYVGDVHGEFASFAQLIGDYYDSTIIQVGDFGIGMFDDDRVLHYISEQLHKNGNTLYICRGNHDCPDYWEQANDTYPGIVFAKGLYNIRGIDVMFVGGGISIDRYFRKTNGNYWENEAIDDIVLPPKFRILVTHIPVMNAVTAREPHYLKLINECRWRDVDLLDDLIAQSDRIKAIYQRAIDVGCTLWISGHLHSKHYTTLAGNIQHYVLDTLETFEW